MPTLAEIRQQYPQYSDMSDADLGSALHKKYYSDIPEADFMAKIGVTQAQPENPYSETRFAQGTSGLNEGIANTLGFPVDLVNMGVSAGAAGINKAFGTDVEASKTPFLGSDYIKGLMSDTGSIQPESEDTANQMIRRASETVGANAIPGLAAMAGAAKPLQVGATLLGSALSGGVSAATAEQAFPDNPTAEMIAEWVGSLGPAGATAMLKKARDTKRLRDGVLSADDLKKMSGDLYTAAENRGVIFDPVANKSVADTIMKDALDQGLDPTLHPRAVAAMKRLEEYSSTPMTVTNARTVQRILGAAGKDATNPDQTRIAVRMKSAFDDYLGSQVPEIAEANSLYSRVKKSGKVDEIKELAGSRAGQFSGSGYENAMRTEMRGLERKIIKGQEKGFTPEEKEAISRVAQGTGMSNTMRNIGRMAPTGPISFGSTVAVPYAAGTALGGPVLGAAAATAATGLGYGARAAATAMGKKATDTADLIIRNGGTLPNGQIDQDFVKRVISALAAATGANAEDAP